MQKKLHKSQNECPFGCIYCFAQMKAYEEPKSSLEVLNSTSIDACDILYPSCDSEFILDKKLQKKLIKDVHNKTIVSISTKAILLPKILKNLMVIDAKLKENDGFLKISVSITTKYSIDKIEPRTASYTERLEALKLLSNSDLASSVNIKPILPSVPLSEYLEIIDDCSTYSNLFLLGGLYVDESESNEMLISKNDIFPELRRVNWLPGKTKWPYIEDKEKISNIVNHIENINKKWFDSDIDLLKHICSESNNTNG